MEYFNSYPKKKKLYFFNALANKYKCSIDEEKLLVQDRFGQTICARPLPYNNVDPIKLIKYFSDFAAVHENYIQLLCSGARVDFNGNITDATTIEKDLLIGTRHQGIWIMKDKLFKKIYDPAFEMPKEIRRMYTIETMLFFEDTQNRLWFYDYSNQVLDLLDHDVNDWLFDPWHKLWYSKSGELRSSTRFINEKPIKLVLEEIYSGDISFESKEIEIQQSDVLNLLFKAYYSPNPNGLIYQYSLNNKPWQDFEGALELNNFRPGINQLSVRARDGDTNISEILSFRIRAEQELLLSYWPYVFSVVLFLLLLALWALRQKNKENKMLQKARETAELKMKMLESQNRFRQSQMSPHFMNNALTAVSAYISTDKKAEAKMALKHFAVLMREVLNHSEKKKILISEEIDFLKAYLELEKMIRPYAFEYEIFSQDLDISIPPMLIQPFVENAVIHGVSDNKSDGRITIKFSENSILLECRNRR